MLGVEDVQLYTVFKIAIYDGEKRVDRASRYSWFQHHLSFKPGPFCNRNFVIDDGSGRIGTSDSRSFAASFGLPTAPHHTFYYYA